MKKRTLLNLLLSALIALLLLGGISLPVSASHATLPLSIKGGGKKVVPARAVATKGKIETFITLTKPQPVGLQDSFILEGELKDSLGRPVKDRSVLFNLGGLYLGQAHTDAAGRFSRKFSKDLDAGSYEIGAYWNGTHDLAPASAGTTLVINPAVVRIQTVPAVSGLAFTIANQRVVSGQDGIATVKIDKSGEYRLNVLVDQYHSTTQRIKFGRWLDESFEPTTTIQVPNDKPIQVGLDVFRLVGQSFLDLDGYPVDSSRITEFMIRSAQGDVFIFHDGQPRWIPASRVARRVTGLEETKLLYSVISVMIDGSNVVNQSQQRFYTYPTDQWPISLLLYSLRISAKDGLFGSPVGKSVNVEYPDGRIVNYPLGKDGTVVIHSLARGNYFTELIGTYGMKNRTPVALSRNQDVNTSVITYLDLTLVVFLALLLALGLLLYGRPSLLFFLRRKTQPVFPEPQWTLGSAPEQQAGAQLIDFSILRYEAIKDFDNEEFKQITGVERELFNRMLSFLETQLHLTVHQSKLKIADQLLLTLVYLREHPSKLELAPVFGVSVGTVRRSIKRVEEALMRSTDFHYIGSLFQLDQPLLGTVVNSNETALVASPQAEPFMNHAVDIHPEPFAGQAVSVQPQARVEQVVYSQPEPYFEQVVGISEPLDQPAQVDVQETPAAVVDVETTEAVSAPAAPNTSKAPKKSKKSKSSKTTQTLKASEDSSNNENEENDGTRFE
jgi:hypothetical protein